MTEVTFTRNGRTITHTLDEWFDLWDEASAYERDQMREWASEAEVTLDDGTCLVGHPLRLMRNRLIDAYQDLPFSSGRRIVPGPRRFLIPGLWPWGTVPALGGNYKAGKSTVVTDLARALVVPGYRFLGHFEPAEFDELQSRGVVVVNAETPPEDFEAALDNGMTSGVGDSVQGWDLLTVEHLEDLGGAHLMDLTDPDMYDLWAHRLSDCNDCDGTDDFTPAVVIVDGVTAILQAAGKDPEDFGLWYAAFRRLLREIDVPNGLPTGHNTMRGGHLMGGTAASAGPDGLWTYSTDRIDNPSSRRRFSVQPRMGGVPVAAKQVVLSEDSRPVVDVKQEKAEPEVEAVDLVTKIAELTAAYVREHPGAHGEELSQNVEDGGWKENNLKGRSKAIALGLIREERCGSGCTICKSPHHRRRHYYAT
jgi:hypothetical protein